MSGILSIGYKEIREYFYSPVAYLAIIVFLVLSGWFFFNSFFIQNQANLRGFFNLLPLTFALVIPAITMRLFAEEFNVGSYEILATLPVRPIDIIIGKFLAGLTLVVSLLLPTLAYPAIISFLGDLDWGPVLGGYLGALFLGGAFTSIGIFTSALTRNQISAFILGALICFFLALVHEMLFFIPPAILSVVNYLGAGYHFQNISKGILDSRDLIYFLSLIFIALFMTHLAVQARK